ncbi:MAG: hypothetical protein COX34_00360 [Candidatus Nealsonbacteria bacterium CG23_combo_of_CG06-09_8_20_14_all_36_12]|uniref:Small ribosomal subunit protein bS6 n=2 Tax=Candidatus Nealsoniibacteriota TaxID=1817911 RepID=A0A2H0TNT6_9BACT|nr:MAG: hypothetical protein COX34_00360 [Candidatus Nealsonbacteria bacterium CG23_combo_of_CG06-09_8_20_14_all_36_12]PIR73087.1 MAG: hypothetical protein COV26_00415 [Candidatus Nealsonbacteria bacterium CG10_big_fil_rev_8_21_14_0_10_36_23]
MRFYELTSLISSKLSEEEARKISEKINSFIQKEEGILDKEANPLKLKLALPIKKERQAYLLTLNFYLDLGKLENLEKKLKSTPEILRFLVQRKKLEIAKILPEKPLLKIKKPLKPREEKVELEEIEKKLEEILGEI